MENKTALMHDVFDKQGNLTKIVVVDENDAHIIDALWDERDAQTHENRQEFRKWVEGMLRRKGYTTLK